MTMTVKDLQDYFEDYPGDTEVAIEVNDYFLTSIDKVVFSKRKDVLVLECHIDRED